MRAPLVVPIFDPPRTRVPIEHVIILNSDGTLRGVLRAAGALGAILVANVIVLTVFVKRIVDAEEDGGRLNLVHDQWLPLVMTLLFAADSIAMLVFLDSFGNFRLFRRASALLPFVAMQAGRAPHAT
jgi:hypothetical protein